MTTQQNLSETGTSRREFILRSTASLVSQDVLDRRAISADTSAGMMIGASDPTHKAIHSRLISPRDILF
ncbi:MAG TPA: hypothetical protein VKU00_05840 [Chthonomonadaceae bacterium]|nr:hypothetical protein [Chthonomonadaceae bacterium]